MKYAEICESKFGQRNSKESWDRYCSANDADGRCWLWTKSYEQFCEYVLMYEEFREEWLIKNNMRVIAKFKVESNIPTDVDDNDIGNTIYLIPVIGGSVENDEFYKWTPAGQITLSTINETAAKQFEVGKEIFVTFSDTK